MKLVSILFVMALNISVLAQNTCDTALPLIHGQTTEGSTIFGTNDNATSGALSCMSAIGAGPQQWYSLELTEDAEVTLEVFENGNVFIARVHVYQGDCGSLSCVAGSINNGNDDPSAVSFFAQAGTYLIRVGGIGSSVGAFTLANSVDYLNHGCMDSNACNYQADAISDDGSCCYGSCLELQMFDSFGDGWNGHQLQLRDHATGELVHSLGLEDGSYGIASLCINDGCYYVEFIDGTFDNEVSWAFSINGALLAEGGGNHPTFSFGLGGDCGFGCTSVEADNYDPDAQYDDGLCLFLGCLDEEATNFDPTANQNDGSCLYQVSGFAFHDVNANGNKDSGESVLANVPIHLSPMNTTKYTDSDGYYEFRDVAEGTATISELYESAAFPNNTTYSVYEVADYYDVPRNFGFANIDPYMDFDYSFSSMFINCGQTAMIQGFVQNLGNVIINGTITIEIGSFFTTDGAVYFNGFNPNTTDNQLPSTYSNGVLTIDINGLYGSQIIHFYFFLTSISVPEFNGQVIMLNSQANFEAEWGLAQSETVAQEIPLICSYDPNEILVSPEGFRDEHYILNDTPLRYRINFQNTGNAPAFDITLINPIDTLLDFNSFHLVQTSHDVQTSINYNTRTLEFHFADIMLPDSVSNEEESHGFVIYDIQPLSALPVGSVIQNTADIIFDINEPVTTNTAYNTITTCIDLAAFEMPDASICSGVPVQAMASSGLGESYTWSVENVEVSNVSDLNTIWNESGIYNLELTVINPLCQESSNQLIEIFAVNQPVISYENEEFSSTPGESYQWYLDGVEIAGATAQNYSPDQSGVYAVAVLDANGCVSTSEDFLLIIDNVEEASQTSVHIYPNPISSQATIRTDGSVLGEMKLYAAEGKLIKSMGQLKSSNQVLDFTDLSAGYYYLIITDSTRGTISTPIVIE
ncbi:MAG: hypothetical protein RLZZ262_1976 [Bacteroidota bacterium]|jgi:uncharacterized repeat protein (TIGR01451 family)